MTIENHNGINVLRDDLLPGGTKSIFLHKILDTTKDYFVYASPVYGGMQIALAHYCSSIGKKAVIFCARRKSPHPNTLRAKAAGAIIYQVPYGYLTNCQAKATRFAEANNGQVVTFGANYPVAIDAIADRMRKVTSVLGKEPTKIYCAVGSGTLIKGILQGTDTAKVHGVLVGADFSLDGTNRATFIRYPKPFDYESKISSPFPSCKNYDLKAWEYCLKEKEKQNILFWNVL